MIMFVIIVNTHLTIAMIVYKDIALQMGNVSSVMKIVLVVLEFHQINVLIVLLI